MANDLRDAAFEEGRRAGMRQVATIAVAILVAQLAVLVVLVLALVS